MQVLYAILFRAFILAIPDAGLQTGCMDHILHKSFVRGIIAAQHTLPSKQLQFHSGRKLHLFNEHCNNVLFLHLRKRYFTAAVHRVHVVFGNKSNHRLSFVQMRCYVFVSFTARLKPVIIPDP